MSTFEEDFARICAMEGPLSERLQEVVRIVKLYDPAFAEAYDDLVGQLKTGEAGKNAPRISEPMPHFLLPNQDNKLCGLDTLLGQGPVVVSFNRGHWCDFCDVELRAFAKAHRDFKDHGASVVAIMPDTLPYIRQVRERTGRAFDILCDMDNGYALELYLAMWLGEPVRRLLLGIGLNLQNFQGNDGWFVPLPATFVIDQSGTVTARFVDPDFRRRMEIEDVLAAVAMVKA
jgi:peroxiredoxin